MNADVQALAINPVTTSTLYVGSDPGGAFKSTDSGNIWFVKNTGLTILNVLDLAIDPVTTSTFFIGTEGGGLFKNTEGPGIEPDGGGGCFIATVAQTERGKVIENGLLDHLLSQILWQDNERPCFVQAIDTKVLSIKGHDMFN